VTKRTLRRKVIIREYDFNKVKADALSVGFATQYVLYDRAEFMPLNQETLEKLKLVEMLKGKANAITKVDSSLKNPALLLYNLKDYLYDERYIDWQVTIDEDGYLCVQSRKNTPKTRIGWGVFEKDLESRL
jgi:hypothetical protein